MSQKKGNIAEVHDKNSNETLTSYGHKKAHLAGTFGAQWPSVSGD